MLFAFHRPSIYGGYSDKILNAKNTKPPKCTKKLGYNFIYAQV